MKILTGMSCSDTIASGTFKHICQVGEKFRQDSVEAVYAIGGSGEVIEKAAGKETHKNYMPMQADDMTATFADIDNLKEEVGLKPNTKIEFGMEQFIAWFKNYYKVGNTNK